MNIEVTRLNQGISSPEEFVRTVNEEYQYKLRKIAAEIAENSDERPIILLSGPSGSGKTTSAMMISRILAESGIVMHTLSMDNYFKSLTAEEKILAAEGKMDLESPDRVDAELLSSQIEAIRDGEEVELPKYNFVTSAREAGEKFRKNNGELVIFEGIHALNPAVITVPDSHVSKIYVSVRTRITDGNTVLHPSRIRLMRRMIRDRNFRQRTLRETMKMFHSVEAGENKYIMPYKYRSDYDIDTFMAYEPAVYRDFLMDGLREMTDVPEIRELLSIMENVTPLDDEFVPAESLVREFIGGGIFSY
ncbi:MAG: nucleoside kinase [Ruminococcus sp.]|nr:nucleoside kinase [Ruminococcus sp.]